MKYAIFTVSLPDLAPEEALREIKAAGYDGVEWRVVDQDPALDGKPSYWNGNLCTWSLKSLAADAPKIKRLVADAGLVMPTLGTYVNCGNLAEVELAMQGAVQLGVPQLRVAVPGYDGKVPYLPLRDRARDQYREVAAMAKQYQVRALIELHMGNILPSASAAASFVCGLDPAQVGIIHDAGNMAYEGYEQYGLGLAVLGPHLAHVHLKNTCWEPAGTRPDGTAAWRAVAAPLDRGIVDLTTLLRALRAVDYDGWISTEDFSTEANSIDKLRHNRELIRHLEATL